METLRSVHVLHAILPFVYFAVFESRDAPSRGTQTVVNLKWSRSNLCEFEISSMNTEYSHVSAPLFNNYQSIV